MAVPVAVCLGLFAVRGGLVELRSAMFEFVPQYVAFSWQDASVRHVAADTIQQWFWQYSLLNPIGLALFAFLPRLDRQMPAVVHVGGIVLVLIAGVAAQAKLLAYHFGAVLPLTSLLAGWGYWKLWMFLRTRRFGLAGLAAVLLAAHLASPAPPGLESFPQREWLRVRAWFNPAQRSAIRDRLYSVADYNARDVRTTVRWLRAHTGTGDRLFIWGFTPEIYVASGRPIASRYVYNLAQRSPWDAAVARSRLMQDLSAAPPGVIIVEYGDRLVRLTGTTKDSAEEIETFPELQHLLKDAYAPAARIGKFAVFARRPGAGTPGRTSHPLPE
jgi:hypothetical protein